MASGKGASATNTPASNYRTTCLLQQAVFHNPLSPQSNTSVLSAIPPTHPLPYLLPLCCLATELQYEPVAYMQEMVGKHMAVKDQLHPFTLAVWCNGPACGKCWRVGTGARGRSMCIVNCRAATPCAVVGLVRLRVHCTTAAAWLTYAALR